MTEFLSKMLTVIIDSALMPTGKNLVPTIAFACGITVVNIILRVFKLPVRLSIGGCFVAVLILLILLIIERSEYSAVSKLYRDVELRVKDLAVRQQEIRTSWKSSRVAERDKKRGRDVDGGAGDRPDNEDTYT